MKEKVTSKYPFCLTDRKKIRVLKGGELDFDNMNKGYYDEIEAKDDKLKELKNSLDKTKSWTIKNSVYANLDVPQIWKNKLTYPTEVLKIFSTDNNFFNYVSWGNPKDEQKEKRVVNNGEKEKLNSINTNNSNNTNTNNMNMTGNFNDRAVSGSLVNRSRNKVPSKKTSPAVSHSNQVNKTNANFFNSNNIVMEETRETPPDSPKVFRVTGTKKKTQLKNIRTFTDKEKREILDIYKERFVLKKSQAEHDNLKSSHTVDNNNNLNLPNLLNSTTSNIINPTDGMNATQKSNMFKSSIYSLLLPTKFPKAPSETSSKFRSKSNFLKNEKERSKTFGPFLNFNYEEYNKKIEIKNPEVRRVLEDIDYYGPNFSHCPSCRNKNLEFYQLQDPHLCLNILNYLKKSRKKGKFSTSVTSMSSVAN